MKVVKNIKRVKEIIREEKRRGKLIGFVPTMGALHEGHLSLIRKCRKECDYVVVSIFVNPLQFGPSEDFDKYPRPVKKDLRLCRKENVDLVFLPSIKEMYPEKQLVFVDVEELSKVLCGRFRPGHFRGVCTVVTKLFNITEPDISYFGQKDFQQAVIIKKMVKDLNMNTKIKVLPIVRDKDGLALSSRNTYLSSEERKQAVCLYKSLLLAKELILKGERDAFKIKRKMKSFIEKNFDLAKIQYIEITDANNLKKIKKIEGKVLVALAVFIGTTRLIDNMLVHIRKDKIIFKL